MPADDPDLLLQLDDEGGGEPLDEVLLTACAALVSERCAPGVTVRDGDEVLQALLLAQRHLVADHRPGLTRERVAACALPIACVAAAGASAYADELDEPALVAALAVARRTRLTPDDPREDALWWSRGLLCGVADAVVALDHALLLAGGADGAGPQAHHEHWPTPREGARLALVALLAGCLEAAAALGGPVSAP